MDILNAITDEYKKNDIPDFHIGDTVRVHIKIKEGSRERIQIFEGFVLKRQNGGVSETFTVRRIASGVGVEKTFPVHSPRIEKIEIVKRGEVRRAKLNYMDRYECRKAWVEDLKAAGYLVKEERMSIPVGTCYRCHTAVEPMLSDQWFVKMDELAKPAIEIAKNKDLQHGERTPDGKKRRRRPFHFCRKHGSAPRRKSFQYWKNTRDRQAGDSKHISDTWA